MPTPVAQNVQRRLAATLFAAFSRDEFPRDLDAQSLRMLLQRDPACLVPQSAEDAAELAMLWPDIPTLPALFTSNPNEHGGRIYRYLHHALSLRWPSSATTELEFTPTWNAIGYSLPQHLREWSNHPITIGRSGPPHSQPHFWGKVFSKLLRPGLRIELTARVVTW